MTALLVLSQFADSHPFDERRVSLVERERVHVGRCNGMNQTSPGNTIFDCKVLSRNHALIWYENGKFWLQDTKSSNGTFVNSNRIGKVSIFSEPYELHSRDVIQFGVSVTENAKKTTHECIISEARLFHPDGQEALQNTTIKRDTTSSDAVRLYELTECLQEACHREELMERKVTLLQQTLDDIYASAEEGWKAMINEDRLLAKIDALETQLSVFYQQDEGKEDESASMKRRLAEAYEERSQTEEASRAMYTKILDEKLTAMRRLNVMVPQIQDLREETVRLQMSKDSSRAEATDLLTRQQDALQQAQLRCERWEQQCALSVGEAQSLQQKMDDVERENHSLRARLRELTGDKESALVNGGGREEMVLDLHGPERETAIISDDVLNGGSELETLSAEFTPVIDQQPQSSSTRVIGVVQPLGGESSERSGARAISPTDDEKMDVSVMTEEDDSQALEDEMATLQSRLVQRESEISTFREEEFHRRAQEYSALSRECDRLRERVRYIEEEMAAAKRENARLQEQLQHTPRPQMNGDLSPDAKSRLYCSHTLLQPQRCGGPSGEVDELKDCLSEVCRSYDNVMVQNRWMSTALCCPIFVLLVAVFCYCYSALTSVTAIQH